MGMLKPMEQDDLTHDPGEDPIWRESFAFHFYDQNNNIGIYTSMGERPYKDHAGAIIGVWGKKGPYVQNFIFDKVRRTDRVHRAQTCEYECVEPLKRWRLRYQGNLPSYVGSPLRLDPAQLTLKESSRIPTVPIEYDLDWSGISPCCKYKPVRSFWDVHLEQHGHVTGWLKVGTEQYEINAVGFRDRSCGIRNWLEVEEWIYTPSFFPSPYPLVELMKWKMKGQDAETDGYIFDRGKGKFERIVASREEVERTEAEHIGVPVKCKFEVETDEGTKVTCLGEVVKIVPVVLTYGGGKIGTMGGLQGSCWIDRCLVKYTFGEGVFGYGEVELGKTLKYPVNLAAD